MLKRSLLLALIASLCVASVAVGDEAQKGSERVAVRVEGGYLYQLVQPEQILRMEDPSFVPKALADGYMGEFEPVIGVAIGDQARAYSAWLMEGYSVINDIVDGQPLVVTWSPFSFSSAVYSRVIDGDTLEFEDSGELWNDAIVMFDKGTHSRWSQLEGRAIDGVLKGQQLKRIPSVYTRWGKWHLLYPQTYCLTKLGREITQSDFRSYYERYEQLGPANVDNPDSRLVGKELICGFVFHGIPVAVPLYVLEDQKQFQLTVDKTPLEIEFDPLTETAVVFSRVLKSDTLSLVRLDFSGGDSYLRLTSDGSTWLAFSGKGVSGVHADKPLTMIPSTLCFWWVWVQHYPLTQLWDEPGTSPKQ